jgi:hypothetical protein
MHLNRGQIAKLFREKSDPRIVSDDPADLMAAARRKLRQAFFTADGNFWREFYGGRRGRGWLVILQTTN